MSVASLDTVSFVGHASAAADFWPAVASDWFHLLMSSLWVGGLVAFFAVIGPVRKADTPGLGQLTGYFSNYARVAVAGLVITGLYATWLQVGSSDGLLTTRYGQALLVKLILFLPLLALAAINLLVTQRRLRAGGDLWGGRLRGLVGAEIILALAILAAVGVMTAISPARTTLTMRAQAAQQPLGPAPQPISEMQLADPLHLHLVITPGWVGENEFQLALSTLEGEVVNDATLIRLRFEHQGEELGESELRIEDAAPVDGVYRVRGANLSVPGDWQIRTTVQRPDQFDTVVDFAPNVPVEPPPAPPVQIETAAPLPYRGPVLLLTGLFALGLGGFFWGQERFRLRQGSGVIAAGLVALGGIFLVYALLGLSLS